MEIQRGIGEPLRVYGFIGIYIGYMIALVGVVSLLAAILNTFNAPILLVIFLPILFLFAGILYIKHLQKKYGHKGRFIARAEPLSKMVVKRTKSDFYQLLVEKMPKSEI